MKLARIPFASARDGFIGQVKKYPISGLCLIFDVGQRHTAPGLQSTVKDVHELAQDSCSPDRNPRFFGLAWAVSPSAKRKHARCNPQ